MPKIKINADLTMIINGQDVRLERRGEDGLLLGLFNLSGTELVEMAATLTKKVKEAKAIKDG